MGDDLCNHQTGITCNMYKASVTKLYSLTLNYLIEFQKKKKKKKNRDLQNQQIVGEISNDFGNLTQLTAL